MASEASAKTPTAESNPPAPPQAQTEVDDFGLPIRTSKERSPPQDSSSNSLPSSPPFHDAQEFSPENGGRPAVTEQQKEKDNKEAAADSASLPNRAQEGGHTGISNEAHQPAAVTGLGVTIEEVAKPELTDAADSTGDHTTAHTQIGHEDSGARVSHDKHGTVGASEWSHQKLTEEHSDEESDSDGEWKAMPALGELDHYDDYGRLVAKGSRIEDEDYADIGSAARGYTRVQLDDDAQSATSMDEDTSYLFKESHGTSLGIDDDTRDPLSQLQATKVILSEGQRIAYVGVVRLAMYQMTKDLENVAATKSSKKAFQEALDSMKKWSQAIMVRLFAHMDIDAAEQVMIEQLAEHGVRSADLVPTLMKSARVENPMAEEQSPSLRSPSMSSPSLGSGHRDSLSPSEPNNIPDDGKEAPPSPGPDGVPEVQTPSQMPTSAKIEIDLRWTVLCDLFLVLISDANYDARSRYLLEQVGKAMNISWMQICRFEKKVIDALEMEQAAAKETWDEAEHMEERRKKAMKKKYMIMGLATVGGGLVIGLSAGLLAPVIGAGLAAGFTTIGISGTGAFLGGAGGTALIASGATLTGSYTGLKASHRRTGAVQTFEYRPLHNNQKVNLIVTVSGWMTGKVDDVRLPFSTVDPIMGDIYSVFWEPEMLQSMGSTINILATEALTQGLQQVLGSTILTALMGALQLPLVLSKLSYLIDNPWNVSLVRANAAGLILADSLMSRSLGKRPITLLGFSLGSRVIFSCLKELARKGAHGIVQNVYMFGSPIVANKDEYMKARSVVVGRFVNGYSSNDWILGYLFRATSGGIMRVSGLAPVPDIPGLENLDCTNLVSGHMSYRTAMPRLLREVGWEVLNDEFAEIEDPDPDNHAERQRELIREIDEARKEAEEKPDKKKFGLFKRSRLAKKKGWETYDLDQAGSSPQNSTDSAFVQDSILFDIDAIKAELASEQIEVKQLESTLPPMKVELNSPEPSTKSSRPDLKQSKSADDAAALVDKQPTADAKTTSSPANSETKPDPNPKSDATPRDDDVQLTFDTSYHVPSHDTRPPLHSAATMPADFGHNAWADSEGHHGEEGEIQMTFE
ncbi:putative membrane protein YFL034W [Talaromyces islandicus]|uniref:Putative membrane protein YFL034W n=1 Tax=Talaromyces islandicus TaxID=28573 RepID=A0A0U1M5E9_TALIS|nr:putative membrane protein YFL034W [Talaromyces islandicus]